MCAFRFGDRALDVSAGLSVGLVGGGVASAETFGVDDVPFFFGEGSNTAVLVIDWFDGRSSLAWGYRFDDGATVEDMLRDVTDAAPRLHTRLTVFSGLGAAVIGLGFDRDGDGFAISDGTDFGTDEVFVGPGSDGAFSLDADDSYEEGFFDGFWGLW